jgi:hypothetical protein
MQFARSRGQSELFRLDACREKLGQKILEKQPVFENPSPDSGINVISLLRIWELGPPCDGNERVSSQCHD